MSLLFIFDMDDVLYRYDWRKRMAGLTELTGLELAELRRRWWHDRGEFAAEAGVYRTAEEYLDALQAAMRVPIPEHEWVRIRGSAMTPDAAAIDAVRRAAELGRVTLLTNNGALLGKHIATLAPELVEVFGREHLFTSAHYGARKPDPEVFERVLAAYGATAEETFFADDLLENIEGAATLGITAHLFTSAERLRHAIEEFARSRSTTRA